MVNYAETNALNKLIDGNKRYCDGKSLHENEDVSARENNKNSQKPYAIVVACADSRVPVETIFDAGIGEIFVIRSAGHSLSKATLGSIEYAVKSLGTKFVLILGHTCCGAVETALKTYNNESYNDLSDNLKSIISHIHGAFDCDCHILDKSNADVIKTYVKYQLNSIQKDDCFMKDLTDNNVVLKGGIYNILSGEVKFLDDKGESCLCNQQL